MGRMKNVPDKLFREVWDRCEFVMEVADHFGMTRTQTENFANRLRNIGYKLGPKRKPVKVMYDEGKFCNIWKDCNSWDEVAARTGLTRREVKTMSNRLRNHGVYLKKFDPNFKHQNSNVRFPLDLAPTQYAPGSKEKIAVMQSRVERGLAIFHPQDATPETAVNRTPIRLDTFIERGIWTSLRD